MRPRRPFWVYWDSKTARVRIHLTDCGACQNGNGMHSDDHELGKVYGWEPADSYSEAKAIAHQKQHEFENEGPINCGLCHPQNH
jgi:hypothetical protein